MRDNNPADFDNQFGGSRINDPYDGNSTYLPFASIGFLAGATDNVGDIGGGGSGFVYTPPTPPNTTFISPTVAQDLLNGNVVINLFAESLSSSEKVDAEFLENDISKGIANSTKIVYSPALTLNDKKVYKAVSSGKILNNYYELEVVKVFVNSNTFIQNNLIPGVLEGPYISSTLFNQSIGTYNYNFDFNRGNDNTPFSRFEQLYSEKIQLVEYTLQDDGTYVATGTEEYKSSGDIINLTFYFRQKNVRVDDPVVDVPITVPSQSEYEISFATNLGLEMLNKIFLEYSIENANGDAIDGGKISVEDGSFIGTINFTELVNGKVRLGLTGDLPKEYSINAVYQNKLQGIDLNSTIDFKTWNTVPNQFELPISELKYGIAVIAEIAKEVKLESPILTVPVKQFDVQVKESDLERGVRIPFNTLRADNVLAYLNATTFLTVNADDKEVILYFQKDFGEVYGTKKVFLVASSDRYGTSSPVEIVITFTAVNDFPSVTEINYPTFIDVPSFSDLNIDFVVSYNTFSATSVDIDLRKRDGSLINIIKNSSTTADFKLNVKKINELYSEWNNGDNKLRLVLRPFNKGGAEVLTGNDYEIAVEINIAKLQLNEDIIEAALMQAFSEGLLTQSPDSENKYLTHLLNFGNNEQLLISNWEEDNWTLSEKRENSDGILEIIPEKEVKSIIVKLYDPIPPNIVVNSTSWITKLLTNPLVETVILTEDAKLTCPPIKGPNFNIEVNFVQGQSTTYEALDDILLSGSSVSNEIIQTYVSKSIIDWQDINIQYASGSSPSNGYLWNNFVHFSSAKERLDNFVYKVQLIETYEKLIISSSTDYTGNGASYTGSAAGVIEINKQVAKKNSVIQSFDGFEKFLFASSSLSWPYNGAVRYSSTSSQVVNWYASASNSATQFDVNNANYVVNNIPQYILNYEENNQYLLFLSMLGQHFDNIYFYAKSIENSRNLKYNITNGISDKLLFDILKSYSWDPKNLNSNIPLWEYALGLDSNGDTKFLSPSKKRNYEIWRRILNNLPYLLKHKGTKRGIYALLSCYGIPSSNLSIIEFGGPEVDATNSKAKLVMDELTYVLTLNTGSRIEIPWKNTENNRTPDSVEIFFKPTNTGSASTLFYYGSTWNIQVSASNQFDKTYGKVILNYGAGSLTTNEFPLFDDKFTGVCISKVGNSVKLDVAKYAADRRIFTQSLSTTATWLNTATGNINVGSSSFTGYIDEIRLWSQPLSSSIFYEHTAWPEMINGNNYSSSTDDLYFRLDFEYPKNLYYSSSVINVATNIFYADGYNRNLVEESATPLSFMKSVNPSASFTASAIGFSNLGTYPYHFQPYDRSVYAPVPSIGASRFLGNKVRFESQTLVSQLSPKYRSTVKSLDTAPIDTNRIGLFFSPNKELNLDIIKSFGGFNFDNYVGDPSDLYKENYKNLDDLREYYFERYANTTRDIYQYINLIKLYEKALFEDIKQMLPARVRATTGLLIEPHLLERSKLQYTKPTGSCENYDDTIDLTNTPVVNSETNIIEAGLDTTNTYLLSGEDTQYQTIIDANFSEELTSDSYQLNSLIETEGLFNVSSLSETGYLESAESVVDTNLDEGTPQKEREAFAGLSVIGQDEFNDVGFGIVADGGYAVRSYFNRFGGVSKERVIVSVLKEKKEREFTYYEQNDDPRSKELKGTEVYYETRVNIQPFYLPGTTTPSTFPTTNDRIVEVTPLRGYLPTHYKNTSDLTLGLENSYWRGCKNTAATTLDGTPPVEVFATNPNTLKVNKAGRDASEPILETE